MLETLQNLLTIVATGTGVYVAVAGLNAWKSEMIGRRDIELCQKVIELFYEAEHKLRILRSPFSWSDEGKDRPRSNTEGQRESEFRDTAWVPLARWNAQQAFWSDFFSFKFRMRALFGDDAQKAFDRVDELLREFRAAAETRYMMISGDRYELAPETIREFSKILWQHGNDDEIALKMRTAIEVMESICIPVVRTKRRWQVGRLRSAWRSRSTAMP